MTIIKTVILVFISLELAHVSMLYFAPESKIANAVGVFTAWEKSKEYPEIHDFVKYLVNWIAGAKLIFLLLLAMIVIYADAEIQRMSLIALAIATLSFFWRLFPLIKKMDERGEINPKNYSTVLGVMIFIFIAVFLGAAFI
ncbi:MAG: hypothetical protein HN855_05325 [Anaerolineae bacterium]|jgi:hypothetical protein|nr:hypothetical protein [Anaerolineae bacterium]MBT7072606.1 hypothetical protein [Anaerolineae bacterium]MBT7324560.1 hypothetical protein [Anaerolineae bacterium]